MGLFDDFGSVEAVLGCPGGPDAGYGGGGVDQDAIQVEEQSAAGDLGHWGEFITDCVAEGSVSKCGDESREVIHS